MVPFVLDDGRGRGMGRGVVVVVVCVCVWGGGVTTSVLNLTDTHFA